MVMVMITLALYRLSRKDDPAGGRQIRPSMVWFLFLFAVDLLLRRPCCHYRRRMGYQHGCCRQMTLRSDRENLRSSSDTQRGKGGGGKSLIYCRIVIKWGSVDKKHVGKKSSLVCFH